MASPDGIRYGEMPISVRLGERLAGNTSLIFDGAPVEPLQVTVKVPLSAVGAEASVRLVDSAGQPVAGMGLLFVGTIHEHLRIARTNSAGVCGSFPLAPDEYRIYATDDDLIFDALDDPDFVSAHANDFPLVRIVAGMNAPLVLTMHR